PMHSPRLRATRITGHLLAALVVALATLCSLATATASQPKAIGRLGLDGIYSMSYSPTGAFIAVGTSSPEPRLWQFTQLLDARTGQPLVMLPRTGSAAPAFSPDEKIVAAGVDTGIGLWDVESGRQIATLPGRRNGSSALAFSPAGRILASGARDDTIRLWDIATHRELATLTGHADDVTALTFNRLGTTLATGGRDGVIKLWDVATRQETATLLGHVGRVNSIGFGAGGMLLASGSDDSEARLWDVDLRQGIATLSAHTDAVNSVAFSPDGRTLATGSSDHTVVLWDVATARQTATFTAHSGPVIMVAFDPNAGALVSGRSARGGSEADLTEDAIRVWDVATRRQTASFGPPSSAVRSLRFSPDGQTLVAADWSTAGQIVVWDIASGSRVATLTGYADKTWWPVFSPDGSILATGGADEVTLWDATTWRPTATLPGVGRYPTFSPDGATLATLVDRDIVLWDVASARGRDSRSARRSPSADVQPGRRDARRWRIGLRRTAVGRPGGAKRGECARTRRSPVGRDGRVART
ncbi:MAG: WD40 repeat domain-containing protein, partial [Candidatus Poribacteria bacterium]